MLNNKQIFTLLCRMADFYEANKEELSSYDAVIGDGDHGFSLARGNMAAKKKLVALGDTAEVSELFKQYGRELTCEMGGAMGPLFGLLFTQLGKATNGKMEMGLAEVSTGLSSALQLICELGRARQGDKTMVDAIVPTVEALQQAVEQGAGLKEGMGRALAAAQEGVASTIPLQARRGRSKYLREKSIGHQDAGATSFSYFIKIIAEFVEKECV